MFYQENEKYFQTNDYGLFISLISSINESRQFQSYQIHSLESIDYSTHTVG